MLFWSVVWGTRVEGKILAIKYARENQMPFFGICLGMQLAVIEYAQSVLKWQDASRVSSMIPQSIW